MSGLVLELQRDALDKNIEVSYLLRKALVVSKKLSIADIEEWIDHELSGYPEDEDIVPSYREVSGEVKVYNPYHGWQPLHFEQSSLGEELSKRKISQAIGQLVSISNNEKHGNLQVPFSQHTKQILLGMMDIALEPSLIVGLAQVRGILESVRNEVLNWALDLESKGIIGNGMSFSLQEKEEASQINYQITNNIGSMDNSQIQQATSTSRQEQVISHTIENVENFTASLKSEIDNLELKPEDRGVIESDISTIESQLSSPSPKEIIITESLKSTRAILEGITGSALATGLIAQLSSIL